MDNNYLKVELARAYKILAHLKLDDHTYTHLSIRAKEVDQFYIYLFGLTFSQVTTDKLIKVSLDGSILEGTEYQYNETGYKIHGNIYKARSDINAIFHVHCPEVVAVSSCSDGLMPISQWALHFYDRISYHNYDSLALDHAQGKNLVADLGNNFNILLRNHGSISAGKTIHEAMFYTYHLYQACRMQIFALSMGKSLITPPIEIARKTVKDLLSFEKDLGKRDWQAWINSLNL